jgi:spore maturation protein CgeB
MKLFVFGSSLTSTYWNGAATYYRGIYKNLHRLGYDIVFAEPDIYGRQQHRDLLNVNYADVRVYQSPDHLPKLLMEAASADLIVKHSGVGDQDERLEREILDCRSHENRVIFWDVDAAATLGRLAANPDDAFHQNIPRYDAVLTYGGGPPVVSRYMQLGARSCVAIYNALDPETHHPVSPDASLGCDLAFVGHRLPDREARVDEFFFHAAELAPEMSFLLGGEGWEGKLMPSNVRWIGHVGSDLHSAVNCSARMVLNVTRDCMADVGFSPPTRVFEAAGAGACLITDEWEGIEQFFCPGIEILSAKSARDVVDYLRSVDGEEASQIGLSMLGRALREHTYDSRAQEAHAAIRHLFQRDEIWNPVDAASQCAGSSLRTY